MLGDSQIKRLLRGRGVRRAEVDSHYAESGWTTQQLKIAVRQNQSSLHLQCFILIGLNDVIQNIKIKQTKTNIRTIVNLLTDSKRTVFISTLPPMLNANHYQQQNIKNINVFIQSLHSKTNVIVLQFHKQFPPFAPINHRYYQLRYANGRPDNLHLSMEGFRLLISLISDVLTAAQTQ